ncbi:hypothetical protein OG21DRAFT_761611 [Imleria badia]|nr:hypothetical protein OG21DRAFT_761611 [Imleria badia]
MHHALHIQDILSNIFGHCFPTAPLWNRDRRRSTATLAVLARTCHEFKEPALDVLWSELIDLTPLPRCIPEACCVNGKCYSLKRRLSEAEWNILRSYTRRIWCILLDHKSPDGWLDDAGLIAICSPPFTDPLFPNLRSLRWQGATVIPAVHISVPSLTSLYLSFTQGDVPALKDFLDAVEALCPNIKHYQLSIPRPHLFDTIICSHIRRQTNLREFRCRGVIFDADTISHVSRISSLTSLSFTLIPDESDWTLSSGSASVFSTLTHLEMGAQSLGLIIGLLSCTRLPAVEDLNVTFYACPSKEVFKSYITTIRNTCSSDSLATVKIRGIQPSRILGGVPSESGHRLTLDDFRPCMAFVNSRHVYINLQWSVGLTDSDLLALASAWPHIHSLVINDQWGWRTTGGITLQGLLQLLQKRGSLVELCIAIHTDSFVNLPHGFETGSLLLPSLLTLNLADSRLRSADVPALADVFLKLGMSACTFSGWGGTNMENIEGAAEQKRAWNQVFDRVMGRFSGPIWERGLVEDDESYVDEGSVEDDDTSEEEDGEDESSMEDDVGSEVDDDGSVEEDEGPVEEPEDEISMEEDEGSGLVVPVDDDRSGGGR